MKEGNQVPEELVYKFIADEIDTVPHLEALLMLWNSRPKQWLVDEMAKALYVPRETSQRILQELTRRGLISASSEPERYSYEHQSEEKDALLHSLDVIYRRELVRVSRMIHAKAPAAVREFARAFRFTKDKE